MILNSLFNIFFNISISSNISLYTYDILSNIIPIYYIQFVQITAQTNIKYSDHYYYFCQYFRLFFFDVNIKHDNIHDYNISDINERRLISVDYNEPIIHYKIVMVSWFFSIILYTILFYLVVCVSKIKNMNIIKSYSNNLLKFMLITYCSITTITINYLFYYYHNNYYITLFALIFTALFIIGFPAFTVFKLEYNNNLLKIDFFQHKYHCLYYIYNTAFYRFTYYLFAKNIFYSFILQIHSPFVQNCLLLLTNLLYLGCIVKHQPFLNNRYKLQTYLSVTSTIIILLLNYIIIFYKSHTELISWIIIVIHIVTLFLYLVPILIIIGFYIYELITFNKIEQKYIDLITKFEKVNGDKNRLSDESSENLPQWVKDEYKKKTQVVENILHQGNIPKWAKKEFIVDKYFAKI